jgi:heat shock protein HtpX
MSAAGSRLVKLNHPPVGFARRWIIFSHRRRGAGKSPPATPNCSRWAATNHALVVPPTVVARSLLVCRQENLPVRPASITAPLAAGAYLLAMAALLIFVGHSLLGATGLLLALAVGAALLIGALPRGSAAAHMLQLGAIPLDAHRAPWLHGQVAELAARAGLRPPALFLLRAPQPNAVTIGTRDNAAVAVTDALMQSLGRREVRAVLAHEIAHIQAGDIWLASLAGTMRRFTGALAVFGGIGLLFTLPALAVGAISVPLPVVLLMLAAPTLSGLLQMALARSREFNADRTGAALSGDPASLAAALVSLEQRRRTWWELMFGYPTAPAKARLTDSHPPTRERVARLLALAGRRPAPPTRIRTIPVRAL